MRAVRWAFMPVPPKVAFQATCDDPQEADAMHEEATVFAALNSKLEQDQRV